MPVYQYLAVVITKTGGLFSQRFNLQSEAWDWQRRYKDVIFCGTWLKENGTDDNTFRCIGLTCHSNELYP